MGEEARCAHLRVCRPLGELLESRPHLFVAQDVERVERDPIALEEIDDLAREAAAVGVAGAGCGQAVGGEWGVGLVGLGGAWRGFVRIAVPGWLAAFERWACGCVCGWQCGLRQDEGVRGGCWARACEAGVGRGIARAHRGASGEPFMKSITGARCVRASSRSSSGFALGAPATAVSAWIDAVSAFCRTLSASSGALAPASESATEPSCRKRNVGTDSRLYRSQSSGKTSQSSCSCARGRV